jgi:hypothetical protein
MDFPAFYFPEKLLHITTYCSQCEYLMFLLAIVKIGLKAGWEKENDSTNSAPLLLQELL